MTERSLILNTKEISQKLMRMAHEIHENNYKEKELILVGVVGRGSDLAQRLGKLLSEISDTCRLCRSDTFYKPEGTHCSGYGEGKGSGLSSVIYRLISETSNPRIFPSAFKSNVSVL